MYISIKQRVQGEAKGATFTELAAIHYFKLVVVVEDDIDFYNGAEVLWAISTRVRADLDIVSPVALGNRLDPADAYDYYRQRVKNALLTTKVIIDATRPVGTYFSERITPNREPWEAIDQLVAP